MSVAILGAGAFGTALAVALAAKGPVTLWARDSDSAASTQQTRHTPRLPGVTLPDAVTVTSDRVEALSAGTILLATPMQALRGLLEDIPDALAGKPLVACCKGIDLATLTGPTVVIARVKPDAVPAILTGPSFAADIARGLPTALTLACADDAMCRALQQTLSTTSLRLYRSADVTGAELGGALKNVIAIACGAVIGAGLGDSARAALMTRGFAEMNRLATHLGAQPETLTGLSGLGDLALTCGSELSRNFRYGQSLGRNEEFDTTTTVEGRATAEAVLELAAREGIDLPICAAVHALASGKGNLAEVMNDLLTRPLKEEH